MDYKKKFGIFSGLLGGPWDLVTTYNWDYKPTYNLGNPYEPIYGECK